MSKKKKAQNSYQLLRGKAHELLRIRFGHSYRRQHQWLKAQGHKLHMSQMTKPELRAVIEQLENHGK
jgi:hypothetical protein